MKWVIPVRQVICSRYLNNFHSDTSARLSTSCTVEERSQVKKKKVAMLIAYNGVEYYGMQKNLSELTVEDRILEGMLQAGLITKTERFIPQSMNYQRGSRTDRYVSAAGQVISLKLLDVDHVVERTNQNLPEDIRILGIRPVGPGFDSKKSCCGRTYSYTLPSFAFTPVDQITRENYRISDNILEEVQSTARRLEGNNFYHNYTQKMRPREPSSRRTIISIKVEKPFVHDQIEFVTIKIKGVSFMLYQIRKMMGMLIGTMRGLIEPSMINIAWEACKVDVPTAPALGLILEEIHYDRYNTDFAENLSTAISWEACKGEKQKFKENKILPTIFFEEIHNKSMLHWLNELHFFHFAVRPKDFNCKFRTPFGLAWWRMVNLKP